MLVLFILFVLIFFIVPNLFIYEILKLKKINWNLSKNLISSFDAIANSKNKFFPFSQNSNDKGFGTGIRYAPHPLTNWSLNPNFMNKHGIKVHNKEGFRKANNDISYFDFDKEEQKNEFKIICLGGSTTYCTDIEKNEDTWPFLLNNSLKEKNVRVFNFGVAHFTTLNAIIRLISWINTIKPNLVILMLAKNDLNLLTNMSKKQKFFLPDFQNIMMSFGQAITPTLPRLLYKIPLFKLYGLKKLAHISYGGFNVLYRSSPNSKELEKRINSTFLDEMRYRTNTIFNICKSSNCNVLYIPEICSTNGIHRKILYESFYEKVISDIKTHKNVKLFDPRGSIPENNKYFQDVVHFTKDGCIMFSRLVSNFIQKNYL